MENKKWLNIEELLEKYPNYQLYYLGITEVDPSKIIGLSRSLKEIANDAEMASLKKNVKRYGWKDPAPEGLLLIQFPDFTYSVCNGGNHRAYFANQLHLKRIPAHVDVLIPETSFSPDCALEFKKLTRQVEVLMEKFRELLGVPYNEQKQQLIDESNALDEKIQSLLKTEAMRLKLIDE